eukprot:scaffold147059_cov38-Cyclotella_meneghiniana.AAC.3
MYKITLRPLDSYQKGIRPVLCTCVLKARYTFSDRDLCQQASVRLDMVPVLSDYHLAYSFFSVSHDVMLEVVGVICGVMGSRSPHKDTNNTITQEFVLMTKPNTEARCMSNLKNFHRYAPRSLPTRQTMSRQSSFRPIDPQTAEVSVGTSDPPSHAARAAADGVSVMMSAASAPTSTHPANPSQEYLDFMAPTPQAKGVNQ